MFYESLFVLLNFFFWPLWCLFLFDLRILITPSYWQTKLLPSASNIINYENRCVGDKRLTDSRVLIFLTGISQIHFLVVTVHVLYLNFHPSATVNLSNSTQSFLAVLSEKSLLLCVCPNAHVTSIFRTDHDVGSCISVHTLLIFEMSKQF
jgi:hypothetical protein